MQSSDQTVSGMWLGVLSFYGFDFSAIMDYNLELWPQIKPFSPKLLFVRVFYYTNSNENRTGIEARIPIHIKKKLTKQQHEFSQAIEFMAAPSWTSPGD